MFNTIAPPLAGSIKDAAAAINRSRNYIYDLNRRGLLAIHSDPLRPRTKFVIFSELLEAIRNAATDRSTVQDSVLGSQVTSTRKPGRPKGAPNKPKASVSG